MPAVRFASHVSEHCADETEPEELALKDSQARFLAALENMLGSMLREHHDSLLEQLRMRSIGIKSRRGSSTPLSSPRSGTPAPVRRGSSTPSTSPRCGTPAPVGRGASLNRSLRNAREDLKSWNNGPDFNVTFSKISRGGLSTPSSDSVVKVASDETSTVEAEAEGGANPDELYRQSTCSSTFSKAEEMRKRRSRVGGLNVVKMKQSASMTSMNLQLIRPWCQRILSTAWCEVATTVFIVLDVIFSGIEVEYMAQYVQNDPPRELWWVSFSFAVFFGLELLLRLIVEGGGFVCRPNGVWNMFDLLVITVAWIDLSWGGVGVGSRNQTLPSIRVVRMARVVRVLRVARIMRHFRSLRILVHSVMNTIRSLVWTLLLLTTIIYVFGLLFTQATTQHLVEPNHPDIALLAESYGTLGKSVFSLFKAISNGVSWGSIVDPLGQLHPIWAFFYLAYFTFTYFAVLNVVTGVFCQTAIESVSHDQELAAQTQMAVEQEHKTRLQGLFQTISKNKTGMITLQDLEACLRDEKLRAYFATLDLSLDEAFSLFKLLDTGHVHVIDTDTFVTGCLKLRGAAKSLDIAKMMYETRWNLNRVYNRLKGVEEKLQDSSMDFDEDVSGPDLDNLENEGLRIHEF